MWDECKGWPGWCNALNWTNVVRDRMVIRGTPAENCLWLACSSFRDHVQTVALPLINSNERLWQSGVADSVGAVPQWLWLNIPIKLLVRPKKLRREFH